MSLYLSTFAIALVIMLAIDAVWLSLVAKNFYATHIGFLLAPRPDWLAAGLFYLIFIGALVYLILLPALTNDFSLTRVVLMGAVFGLVTYATYDLTNQATVHNWPWTVTLVDLVWGTVLTAVVSVGTVWLIRWWG